MGTVLATSKSSNAGGTKLPLLENVIKDSEPTIPKVDSSKDDLEKVDNYIYSRNVGTIEDLNKKCKEVMPTNFEGAKLMVNKGLSNHFQVSHTIHLCSSSPSGYRFGATFVGTKQFSPNEAFPVILGDIDPSGNLNANIIHQFTDNIRCKFATKMQPTHIDAAQITTDYKGNDFTASLTLGNPNLINKSGIIVAHYLQAVTNKLDLGAELAYQYGPAVPAGAIAVMSGAARYTNGSSIWSGTLSTSSLHLCYYQKASEQLQLGVEVESNFRTQEAVATIGYQIDLPKADLIFRGMVDSNWTVSAVMEKKLKPLPFTFALSGLINHTRNQFNLGVGLIIG